jgi:hypothetical protein
VVQQFAILASSSSETPNTLGDRRKCVERLSVLNTGPERPDDNVLWGPGIRLELKPGQDPVMQMLLTIVEDEIAWLTMMRLARLCQWKIVDLESGEEIEPE